MILLNPSSLTDAHLTGCAILAGIEIPVSLATGSYGIHPRTATTLAVRPVTETVNHL